MDSLAFYITVLRKDFVKYCKLQLAQFQLTEGLLHYLIYIGKNPNCTLSEISAYLLNDNGHTTRSIDKLETLGYLQRISDGSDKRKVMLTLTDKGYHVFQQLKTIITTWDKTMLKDFSNEEKKHLYYLLQKIDMDS